MTRPRPALILFMSFLALCNGFTTIKPHPCARVSLLWMQSRHHQLTHKKPCSITYFQADETALEFEDAETPVSKHFDQIKRMVCFLWTRIAIALLHLSQSAAVSKLEDVSTDTATLSRLNEIPQEATQEGVLEWDDVKQMEAIPDAIEENSKKDETEGDEPSSEHERENIIVDDSASIEPEISQSIEPTAEMASEAKEVIRNGGKDEVEADVTSIEDEKASISEETAIIDPEKSEVIVPLTDIVKEAQVTSATERPSTMHKKEGDRAVGLKDEFLDPISEAISLDFGRPLEIIEADVPPLREKLNSTAYPK